MLTWPFHEGTMSITGELVFHIEMEFLNLLKVWKLHRMFLKILKRRQGRKMLSTPNYCAQCSLLSQPIVPSMFFYPDFILILPDFILILSRFYTNLIKPFIKSLSSQNKLEVDKFLITMTYALVRGAGQLMSFQNKLEVDKFLIIMTSLPLEAQAPQYEFK